MSLHKLINLCQSQARRQIWTNATSAVSDACHPTPHELCALHLFSMPKPLISTRWEGQAGHPTTPPQDSALSSFPAAFPHSYQHFKLTLKTYRLCVAEFQALLLTLSAWTRSHHTDGKEKGKELVRVPCKAAARRANSSVRTSFQQMKLSSLSQTQLFL